VAPGPSCFFLQHTAWEGRLGREFRRSPAWRSFWKRSMKMPKNLCGEWKVMLKRKSLRGKV
jgi:hypothetical protein